jgi:hypothetical protein
MGSPILAAAADSQLNVRVGVEQTTGDYGGGEALTDRYLPVTLQYSANRLGFRVTVPYLELEFSDPTTGTTFTESGLGDVVLGFTFYDAYRSRDGSVLIDLTGKIKLGTADEAVGLGTGETDYAVQADFFKLFGRATFVGSLGYKVRGEPVGFALEDSWLLSTGGMYRFSDRTSGGLFLDYRESAVAGAVAIRELTASVSRQLNVPWRLQAYLVHGVSDASADYGAGLSIRRNF